MQYDLLNTLKTNLAKSTDPGAKIHPPLMALKAIAASNFPITVEALSSTQIGKVVNSFKNDESEMKWGKETADLARAIVKKWKKLAKGVPTPAAAPQLKAKSPAAKSHVTPPPFPAAATALAATLSPSLRGKVLLSLTGAFLALGTTTAANDGIEQVIAGMENDEKERLALESASGAEGGIAAKFPNFCKLYIEKARSLAFNLKKNKSLAASVMIGEVESAALSAMSSADLATKESLEAAVKMQKEVEDARRLDWEDENAEKINKMCGIEERNEKNSLFTCGRCKSIKTSSTQKQTRSADEPMTIFVHCQNCGNRWRC